MTKPIHRPSIHVAPTAFGDTDTKPGRALVAFKRHETPTLPILLAINKLWGEIQANNPGTPNVNIVLQASEYAHGHFAPGSWQGAAQHELMLSTVSLALSTNGNAVIKTVSTLLHEAAHAYAHENQIKDTSRNGRWHNKRFAELATRFGCEVEANKQIGHSTGGISPQARALYGKHIQELQDAVTVFRKSSSFDWSSLIGGNGAGPIARKPRAAYGSQTTTVSCLCRTQRVDNEFWESLSETPTCRNCETEYAQN